MRSGVIIDVLVALQVADGKDTRLVVEVAGPISNGLTTVGGAKTRFLIYKIGHGRQRHELPICSGRFERKGGKLCRDDIA